jgi:hypothetical protein
MRVWSDHVLRYSRRDQLSESVAFAVTGTAVKSITLDNLGSPLHEWPTPTNRRFSAFTGRLDAPIESADDVRLSLDELVIDAANAVEARDVEIQVLQDELAAMRRSRSWAVTAPIRSVSDLRAALARRLSR